MTSSFTESPALSVTAPLKPDTSDKSILSSSIIRPSKFTFSLASPLIQPSKFHNDTSQSSSVPCNLSVSQVYSVPHSRRDSNEVAVPSPFDDEQVDCMPYPMEMQVNAFTFLGTSKAQNVKPRVCRRKHNHLKGHFKRFNRRKHNHLKGHFKRFNQRQQRYFLQKPFREATFCKQELIKQEPIKQEPIKQEPMDVSNFTTSETKANPKDSDVSACLEVDVKVELTCL